MKIGLCAYSGYRIYPGHGKALVKADGKMCVFLNSKCERAYVMKRNPRKVTWTVLYRRKHKKGQEEETRKKRTRRTQRYQRAIAGASLSDILAKRGTKLGLRGPQREQAVKNVKDKKKATAAADAAISMAKNAKKKALKRAAQPAQKVVKVVQKSAPKVGFKR